MNLVPPEETSVETYYGRPVLKEPVWIWTVPLYFYVGGVSGAALVLGASAVQIGTGFLRTPEAKMHPAFIKRLANTEAHDTMITRAFSGRPGRSAATAYVRAASASDAPHPAPYPVQRGLTRAMREAAQRDGDGERMQLWAGQAAKLALDKPAGVICQQLWVEVSRLLS